MSTYEERLQESLGKRFNLPESSTGRGPHGYRSIWKRPPRRRTLGEEFLEALEETGDYEATRKKFVKKGIQYPGSSREKVEMYLDRILLRAQEEGRL